jgi:hypothetical protein
MLLLEYYRLLPLEGIFSLWIEYMYDISSEKKKKKKKNYGKKFKLINSKLDAY